jgi:hypothetical protein
MFLILCYIKLVPNSIMVSNQPTVSAIYFAKMTCRTHSLSLVNTLQNTLYTGSQRNYFLKVDIDRWDHHETTECFMDKEINACTCKLTEFFLLLCHYIMWHHPAVDLEIMSCTVIHNIYDIFSLNLGWVTGNPHWGLRGFPQSFQANSGASSPFRSQLHTSKCLLMYQSSYHLRLYNLSVIK